MVSFKPLHQRVLILPTREEEEFIGSLYVPEESRTYKPIGVVVAVGAKVNNILVGKTVIHGPAFVKKIVLDDIEYLLMLESDIFAVL